LVALDHSLRDLLRSVNNYWGHYIGPHKSFTALYGFYGYSLFDRGLSLLGVLSDFDLSSYFPEYLVNCLPEVPYSSLVSAVMVDDKLNSSLSDLNLLTWLDSQAGGLLIYLTLSCHIVGAISILLFKFRDEVLFGDLDLLDGEVGGDLDDFYSVDQRLQHVGGAVGGADEDHLGEVKFKV
jgi:hypothetical protein